MIEFSEFKELPTALCELQNELQNPTKSTQAYNYKYATLDQILNDCKKIIFDHGFSVVQLPYNDDDIFGVETMLLHSNGEYIKARFGSKPKNQDAQTIGSLITYYRRYTILSLFNLAPEVDDDGAKASPKAAQDRPATEAQKKYAKSLMGQAYTNLTDAQKKQFENMTNSMAQATIEKYNSKNKD
jgi:hypothetical protein